MPTIRVNADRKSLARVETERLSPKYIRATNRAPPALGAITNSRNYGTKQLQFKIPQEDKLPDLAPKPPLKPRVETATTRLVTKYWSNTRDRFARLSSTTAPGKLQTTPQATEATYMLSSPITRQLNVSPTRPSAPPPGSYTPADSPDFSQKKRELAIFKSSNRYKSYGKQNRAQINGENEVNKYHSLRSHSYADKVHENNGNNCIAVTFQDLAKYSQKAMEKHEPAKVSTILLNSYLDVSHFRKLIRDPHEIGDATVNSANDLAPRRYVNYCDKDKTKWIESWLIEVERVQSKEGKCTNVIDNSLKILPFLTDKT